MRTFQRPWIRVLSTVLVLALMAGIFLFSSQGSSSEDTSEVFAFMIIDTVHPEYADLSAREQVDIWSTAQRIARKTAHIVEYMVLGFLIRICLESWFGLNKKHKWLAFAIGSLYAVSDELHQYFVPGRSCEIVDMLIDSIGVFLGVLLAARLIRTLEKTIDRGEQVMKPWNKKKLAGSLLLAVLFGALLTLCFELGMSYLRPENVGSFPKHLLHFGLFSFVMIAAVLLCAFCRPVRNLWNRIDRNILDSETRKPFIDIIYAIVAGMMLLHHFYVILYYPTLTAGAVRFAPVWIVFAALTVILGRSWRECSFRLAAVSLVFAFERLYIRDLSITGTNAVYFASAIYALFICLGVFSTLRPSVRIPFLKTLCALFALATLALSAAGLYTAWTGIRLRNLVDTLTRVRKGRLWIFAYPTITATYIGCGGIMSLMGYAVSKHKPVKILYLFACLVAMVANSLTDARASFITLAFMISGTLCLGVWTLYRNRKPEKHSSGRKTALVVASLVLCFGLCFYLAVEGQRALGAKFVEIRNSGIIPAAEAETPAAEVTPEPVETPKPTATPKPPKFKQRDVWFSEDKEANKTLSNRLVLWQRAFEYLRNDPRTLLCGLSVEGERITEVVEDVHCHNLLVQTLLEGGIPGLLLFLALVFCGVFHAFRLWSQKGIPFWQRLLPLPMFTILLWEMAECVSHFSYGHPPMTLLWFFMGCTVAASKSLKGLKTSPAAEKAIGE